MTTIQSISPNFQGNVVTESIKRTITDPTDVRNKDAAIGGTIAAGSVSGAAAVASKFRALRHAAVSTTNFAAKASKLKKANISLIADFFANMKTFFANTKATKWISRLMETPAARKIGGGLLGVSALGITAAQLFSAGDMAVEALQTYRD